MKRIAVYTVIIDDYDYLKKIPEKIIILIIFVLRIIQSYLRMTG